eukprot:366406-Chlamydomonas_euryale.AAC.35
MQAQNQVMAPALVTVMAFFLNIGLNMLFINWLGFQVRAPAMGDATCLSGTLTLTQSETMPRFENARACASGMRHTSSKARLCPRRGVTSLAFNA